MLEALERWAVINGENACGSAQIFESKLVRTRTALYKAFVESFAS